LTFFFAEICAKRIELIKEAVPAATRLGVLVNPANPSGETALIVDACCARATGAAAPPRSTRSGSKLINLSRFWNNPAGTRLVLSKRRAVLRPSHSRRRGLDAETAWQTDRGEHN
jgi:hypothetical protein